MEKFIKTSDEELAGALRACGYKELKKQGKFFVFLNSGKLNFTEQQKKNIIYSDKLCI